MPSSFETNSKLTADSSVDTLRGVPLLGVTSPVFLAYCKLYSRVTPWLVSGKSACSEWLSRHNRRFFYVFTRVSNPTLPLGRYTELHTSITGGRQDRMPRTVGQTNKNRITSCHARARVPQNRAGSTRISDGLALLEARQPDICDQPSLPRSNMPAIVALRRISTEKTLHSAT